MKSLEKSGSLTTNQYKKIKSIGSRPGIWYGLCKVHKAIIDVSPPFISILLAIGTPSYKLAKVLVPKLTSITFNEFTVEDSFPFAEEIVYQKGKFFMGSLDIDSLFTNIPLEETINICTNLLYNNVDVIEGINKSEFENLLSLATQESYYMFNDILYKQKNSVAMGSPLGPPMPNFFYRFMNGNGLNSALTNSNQFFTEYVLMIFLFYLNQPNISQNSMHISIHVILTWLLYGSQYIQIFFC